MISRRPNTLQNISTTGARRAGRKSPPCVSAKHPGPGRNTVIRISEIFGPTIQGEGVLIGKPTVFVRTGGCDYRCSWCDTLHAVDSKYRNDWKPMSAEEIFAKIKKLSGNKPLMISLSGGNPAIQPLGDLIMLGKKEGYGFALETQGSIPQDWFADLDVLTLSPKPPSSGTTTDWNKLDECVKVTGKNTQTALKIVIFDDQDYAYAKIVAEKYPQLPLYLQPGNPAPPPAAVNNAMLAERLRWLAEKVTSDQWFNATVLPQLHVMIWGNQRGV
ncbi:MAG: 7-carboxy-7-deazaguanine synthase QueE [Alphaproteobacteria bacterium]|nr:7-carboxy-7-deazaguanine synthase QueE [Alphaproteobacteria bacterium]